MAHVTVLFLPQESKNNNEYLLITSESLYVTDTTVF
uniref:Uncharacterized protein n=1 Tax=Anguilla anguilla TaxID=7936 RepID=A0A0E9RIY5_ANGAN